MSLLFFERREDIDLLAKEIYKRHFELDPKLETEYDDRRKMIMYDDILINLGYLDTAIRLDDSRIFSEYAIWIFSLLCSLMKDIDKERIKEQMVMHYQILLEVVSKEMKDEDAEKAKKLINKAIQLTEEASIQRSAQLGF